MDISKQFEDYMTYLSEGLGHADRHSGLGGYCAGLMRLLFSKSVDARLFTKVSAFKNSEIINISR